MKSRLYAVALCVVGLLLLQQPGAAQGFNPVGFNTLTTNVTLTTTTETSVVNGTTVTAPKATMEVCVFAWAQLTTGAATTTVTPRLRRGSTTSGTLLGEANAITIGAAAGSTEQYFAMACEERSGAASLEYNFTLQQASASGNGTALFGAILILVR